MNTQKTDSDNTKVQPHNLIVDSLYIVRGRQAKYLGIDNYKGETTYKFEDIERKRQGGLGQMDNMPWDMFIKPQVVSTQVSYIP